MRRHAAPLIAILPAVLLMCAAPLLAQSPTCGGGRLPRGDVGIRALRCTGPGASCAINIGEDGRHEFAVEPVVADVKPVGPDDAELHRGDTLVAVDGLLITTREGGRRLADPPLDRRLALLVRRRGALVEVWVRPVAGCGVSSLAVTQ